MSTLCAKFPTLAAILIEGPGWLEPEFYSIWMAAAFDAQHIWDETVDTDLQFYAQVKRLEADHAVKFGTDALKLTFKLYENLSCTVIVDANSDLYDRVALLALMGFFVCTGDRYQMVLPPHQTAELVRTATLKLAETEDADHEIHPEYLVKTIPLAAAQGWQRRLQEMNEGRRVADRTLH
jgi:hypothetical protein